MIYHIYWGTSGNSGLYLDEIYQILHNADFKQRVFVSYYYPFNYGDKVFFRFGDVEHSPFKGKLRKIIQLFEIIHTFLGILISAKRDRPMVVNYSHIGKSYSFIYHFLKTLKKISGSKLVITCHDVIPRTITKKEMNNRQLIFNIADFLLVHNDNSINELNSNFDFDKCKILSHPFPMMDMSKLYETNDKFDDIDFLFIGHLRKDKGVEFLLETWKEFHKIQPEAKLYVCGRKTDNVLIEEEVLSHHNVYFYLDYISDEDYYKYLKSTRYVILPYFLGTNSGIISTVLSLGTNVITSDIPMFNSNPLVDNNDMFVSKDKQSLLEILQRKYVENVDSIPKNRIQEYRNTFGESVIQMYESISRH